MLKLNSDNEYEKINYYQSSLHNDKLPFKTNQFSMNFDSFFDIIDDYIILINDLKKSSLHDNNISYKQYITS